MPPDAPDDARDERLARALAVEPLDDLTRRRLVVEAMHEARSERAARRARLLVAAAAVVLVAVAAGGAFVALRGHSEPRTREQAQLGAPKALGDLASGMSNAPDVGDFGDLGQPANRARLERALDGAQAAANGAASPQPASGETDRGNATPAAPTLACAPKLPAGAVVAVASGKLAGHRVVVVHQQRSDGSTTTNAIDAQTCAVLPLP